MPIKKEILKELRKDKIFLKYDNTKNDNDSRYGIPITEKFPTGYNDYEEYKADYHLATVAALPMACGRLLGQAISSHPKHGGEEFMNIIIENFKKNYSRWNTYQNFNKNYDKVLYLHSRDIDLETVCDINPLILVDYTATPEEIHFLQERAKYLTLNMMSLHSTYTNLQIKYHRYVKQFVKENHKNYYLFPLTAFLKSEDFVKEVNKLFTFLNLEDMPIENLKKLFKEWQKTNIKFKVFVEKVVEDIENSDDITDDI